MKYKITHTTTYAYSDAVPVCHNAVHLTPRDDDRQSSNYHRLTVHPVPSDVSRRLDYFGNHVSYFSIDHAHRKLTVTATSRVKVCDAATTDPSATPWETIAREVRRDTSPAGLDVLQFVFDSPHVAGSDELARYAGSSFAPARPMLSAVLDLTARIHSDFEYDARATTVNTPLEEVFHHRRGVCQDLAHVAIGCLRSLGLPARYVSGYLRTQPPPGEPRLVGADASHAWLAVYCGQLGWVDVDPTNNLRLTTDHVTIAWGRDYSDVAPIAGVFVGGGQHTMSVSVDVAPLD